MWQQHHIKSKNKKSQLSQSPIWTDPKENPKSSFSTSQAYIRLARCWPVGLRGGLGQCTMGGGINSSGWHTKVGRRGRGSTVRMIPSVLDDRRVTLACGPRCPVRWSQSKEGELAPLRSLHSWFRCKADAMAAAAAAVFWATRRCCAVTHILCCQRNFLLTANARFQFPHQSVTAPGWADGCCYCKQRPCCFIWPSEACRENPDLCSFINQKWGI